MRRVSSCDEYTSDVFKKSIRQTDIYTASGIRDFVGSGYEPPMKNVKRIRLSKNMTQVQLAEAVGVKQATISRIEKGVNKPSLDVIEDIAEALGVTPVELFGLPAMEQMVLQKFREASEKRRAALLALLESD